MSNIVQLDNHQKKEYPIMLSEAEQKELIECGYDPTNPEDVEEYWDEIMSAADLLEPS